MIVNTAPAITGQPTTTQSVCVNAATTLTVTATGTNLTYQWFSNASNSTMVVLQLEPTATPILRLTTTAGTTYYYVVVSNGGCAVATSNTAQVIVNTAPAITGQPATTQMCV